MQTSLLRTLCCLSLISTVFGTNLRLVGGSDDTQGRVEVYAEDEWGTVCDDMFGIEEAMVICRQLGFTDMSQSSYRLWASFGQGTGPIHLDNLNCIGTEKNLLQCDHPGIGVHNCGHSEDAGVVCAAPGMDGCLSEPDCNIPAADCPFGRAEYVNVPHRRCPICRCASFNWPAVIEEPNTISVGLLVAVIMVALVAPTACLVVVFILKRKQDKEIANDRKKKERVPGLAPPKQDNWFSNA